MLAEGKRCPLATKLFLLVFNNKSLGFKADEIYYSSRYYDDEYEYRHVNVPKQIARWMPEGTFLNCAALYWR